MYLNEKINTILLRFGFPIIYRLDERIPNEWEQNQGWVWREKLTKNKWMTVGKWGVNEFSQFSAI